MKPAKTANVTVSTKYKTSPDKLTQLAIENAVRDERLAIARFLRRYAPSAAKAVLDGDHHRNTWY